MIVESCSISDNKRQEISLNGTWELTKTDNYSDVPTVFESKVPVPGVIDMANPSIQNQDTLYENTTYWYRTKFKLNHADKKIVKLKINKAKYSTKVYLNSQLIGLNVYSFTPSLFDLKSALNDSGEENELIISVGCKNNLPDTVAKGFDFEKTKYIPGIYDDVKLILANGPYINNIQTVPNVEEEELRVVADIDTDNSDKLVKSSYVIRELVSKKVVVQGTNKDIKLIGNGKIDFTIPIPDCKLWSPENPFLFLPHRRCRIRHGITTQINDLHTSHLPGHDAQ